MDGWEGGELERENIQPYAVIANLSTQAFHTLIMQPVFAMMMRVILKSMLVTQVEEIALKHLKD